MYTGQGDDSNISMTAHTVRETRVRVSRSKESITSNAQVKSFDKTICDHREQHAKKKTKISRDKGNDKASAEPPWLDSITANTRRSGCYHW